MSDQQQKPPRIEVVSLRPITGAGNLRAFASIKVGPIVINDVRLIQQPGQKAWSSPPQSEWQDNSGQTRYKKQVEWPPSWGDAVTEALTQTLDDYPQGVRQVQEAKTTVGREAQAKAGVGNYRR